MANKIVKINCQICSDEILNKNRHSRYSPRGIYYYNLCSTCVNIIDESFKELIDKLKRGCK